MMGPETVKYMVRYVIFYPMHCCRGSAAERGTMKIVIIGAGAMGCLYGAYLSRNNDVVMLDSYKPQVDAINEHGIRVLEEDGTEGIYDHVRAALSGEYR